MTDDVLHLPLLLLLLLLLAPGPTTSFATPRWPEPAVEFRDLSARPDSGGSGGVPSTTRWFDPVDEFGPLKEDRPDPSGLPLLLMLPGLDGSGATALIQFAELSQGYELSALVVSSDDRSSFDDLLRAVLERADAARAANSSREVLLLGESVGAGVALAAARALAAVGGVELSGLVLVSPATSWDEVWLGRNRRALVALPGPLFGLALTLSSLQLLDVGQFASLLRRLVVGPPDPPPRVLAGAERAAFAERAFRALIPALVSTPPATVRHRIVEWCDRALDEGDRLLDRKCLDAGGGSGSGRPPLPLLVLAGTADLRVPAQREAERFVAAVCAGGGGANANNGLAECFLVEGAGHAGALDERVDLRAVMDGWRRRARARAEASGG